LKNTFTILLLSVCFSVFSQSNLSNLRNISTEVIRYHSGLSQNSVRTIHQDKFGFMWFGTWDGLNRYDGAKFDRFNESNKANFNSYSINNIREFNNDILYLATESGVSTINTITFETSNLTGLENDTIYDIILKKNEMLWIASHSGLKLYKQKTV